MELLCCLIVKLNLCLIFEKCARLFSNVVVQFFMPISNIWRFYLSMFSSIIVYYYSYSCECMVTLYVVSKCNSLMTNDVENLFMCFATIHISSIAKYPFISFALLKKIGLCCWNGDRENTCLYILWIQIFYLIYDIQIFSLSVACLFIFFIGPFKEQKFLLWRSPTYLVYGLYFWYNS